jgi:hypothetical protein
MRQRSRSRRREQFDKKKPNLIFGGVLLFFVHGRVNGVVIICEGGGESQETDEIAGRKSERAQTV